MTPQSRLGWQTVGDECHLSRQTVSPRDGRRVLGRAWHSPRPTRHACHLPPSLQITVSQSGRQSVCQALSHTSRLILLHTNTYLQALTNKPLTQTANSVDVPRRAVFVSPASWNDSSGRVMTTSVTIRNSWQNDSTTNLECHGTLSVSLTVTPQRCP